MNERIEKLRSFLVQSPNDCFLNHALALEYVKLGDETEAQKLFEYNLQQDVNYVATYYHLGKLLERIGQSDVAMGIYEKGMQVAKSVNDMHSYNELQGSYEDLVY
ncbi:MAG: hypothetical protein EOP51_08440 [Sphingobacteriales bacterium]|nr:MAG: hypothetical protein EOP51_08440 [Sphingobacteriales bacterium]